MQLLNPLHWQGFNYDYCDIQKHPFFFHRARLHTGSRSPHFRGITITLRHATFGRTPVNECSARRVNLTTQNTRKRQIFMLSAGFEPEIPESQRPQNHT
jgi:hypothetical protein